MGTFVTDNAESNNQSQQMSTKSNFQVFNFNNAVDQVNDSMDINWLDDLKDEISQ